MRPWSAFNLSRTITLVSLLVLVALSPAWSQPVISEGGVLNAADYSNSIAGGSMVAIFGSNLAGGYYVAGSVPLPKVLAGVEVEIFDDNVSKPAAIWFVSENQINAQLPFNITSSKVYLRVLRGGMPGDLVRVDISDCGPGFYTWTGTGQGEVAAIHAEDWTLVNSDNPAVPEEYLILYATGLGPVSNAPPLAGQPGGDNEQWGPLNYTSRDVQVTIGGQAATVVFAGLAPGFVGLYQINVQVPINLGAGKHPIVVQAGGAASQGAAEIAVSTGGPGGPGDPGDPGDPGEPGGPGGVPLTGPASVVKRAMEAQIREDIDGFLAECVTEGHTAEEIAAARELLNLVRNYTSLSNFEFTHLATGLGDLGTLAVVRAYVSYTAQASDGTHQMKHGALAFLKKVGGVWKILHIVPDDLLNQQIYEDSVAKSATYSLPFRRAGGAVNLEDLNNALNTLLNSASIDEVKLGRSLIFGVIGTVPVAGDTLANINQVAEAAENSAGGVVELLKNGFTGIALIKFKQVGVGVLQIVCEPIPGLDTQADMVQASLEQLGHNLERARSIGQIKQMIRGVFDGSTEVNPYLFPYPGYAFKIAAGVEIDPVKNPPQHSYGVPPGTIRITAPTALDHMVPLMIAGELPIPAGNPAALAARELGGEERGGTIYMPVEVGFLAESDESNGDFILDDYLRYRTEDSVSRVVAWNVTCRRGKQDLKVRLRNGEVTPAVVVENEFMNKVEELVVEPLNNGKIKVAPDAPATGLRVIGRGPMLESRFWPDLTNRPRCLDMAVADPDVAALIRGERLTVNGLEPGETSLELLLAGSASGMSPSELEASVPIEVTGEAGPLFEDSWSQTFYNDKWKANLSLRISSAKNELRLISDGTYGAMRQLVFEGDEVATYNVDVTMSGVEPVDDFGIETEIKAYGQFDGGSKSESSSHRTTIKLPADNGSTVGRTAFNIIVYRKWSTDGDFNWEAGDSVIYITIMGRD